MMANWTHRHDRGRVMALWGTCYQLGSVGAKSLAGHLFIWFGLSWSYWGEALGLAVILVVFFFCARERPETHGLPPMDDDTKDVDPNASTSAHPTARIMTIIVAMGMIYFAFKFLRYAFDSWSALI